MINVRYEIPDHVIHNIKEFMLRVDLKGQEVPAYVEILNILNTPISKEDEEKTTQ